MKVKDYTVTLTVNATPSEVFQHINNVAAWWTDEWKGQSKKLNDTFTVQFADMHISTQQITEFIPDQKVVWLVTKSNLSFITNKSEWTNTSIRFELSTQGNTTKLVFTHAGLSPDIECYKDCCKGWDYYIKGSLHKLLTEGKGTPGL